VLREQEADVKTEEVCRRHGILDRDFLQVEIEVRRVGGLGRQGRIQLWNRRAISFGCPTTRQSAHTTGFLKVLNQGSLQVKLGQKRSK
jgi:hypothetical protein